MELKEIFKDAPEGAKKLGVVGYPLSHSLSPVMQTAAIQALGLNAVYKKIEIDPKEWKEFVRQAAEPTLDGFNVTVPYKERVRTDWPGGAENISGEEVELSGAVNTVDREDMDGKAVWSFYNTDGFGFADDLDAEGVDVSGKNMVLLGAGGAARAILSVFGRLDPAKITLINRTPERAEGLAGEFRKKLGLDDDRLVSAKTPGAVKKAVAEAALVVNATSAGLKIEDKPPIDLAWLHENLVVYDLVYHRETEFLKAAQQAGATAIGGLGMLVRQGAKSFEIWFGRKAPFEAMRQAAEKELEKRSQHKGAIA